VTIIQYTDRTVLCVIVKLFLQVYESKNVLTAFWFI